MARVQREILITNDDGIDAPALEVLARYMSAHGHVSVVAPEIEMSGQSHAITLNRPLRYREVSSRRFSVDGTPADCVILATARILEQPPSLVVSGINRGKNIGDSVLYSGTIAAACEAALQGIPSIAVSVEYSDRMDYEAAAECTSVVAHKVLEEGFPPDIVLNLNFPTGWNGRLVLTRQGVRAGKGVLIEDLGPEAGAFWLHEEWHEKARELEGDLPSDDEVMEAGYASLTPLELDRTAFRYAKPFSEWTDVFDVGAFRKEE
jgi:5'-nucleotidase